MIRKKRKKRKSIDDSREEILKRRKVKKVSLMQKKERCSIMRDFTMSLKDLNKKKQINNYFHKQELQE